MPGSLNWSDPDYDESDALPLSSEERASTNLQSPAFEKAKPDATVANAAVASQSIPARSEPDARSLSFPGQGQTGQTSGTNPTEEQPSPPHTSAEQVPAATPVGNVADNVPQTAYPDSYVPPTAQAPRFARDQERRKAEDERRIDKAVEGVSQGDPYLGGDGRWKRLHADPLTNSATFSLKTTPPLKMQARSAPTKFPLFVVSIG